MIQLQVSSYLIEMMKSFIITLCWSFFSWFRVVVWMIECYCCCYHHCRHCLYCPFVLHQLSSQKNCLLQLDKNIGCYFWLPRILHSRCNFKQAFIIMITWWMSIILLLFFLTQQVSTHAVATPNIATILDLIYLNIVTSLWLMVLQIYLPRHHHGWIKKNCI